jgi:hypothetical protein
MVDIDVLFLLRLPVPGGMIGASTIYFYGMGTLNYITQKQKKQNKAEPKDSSIYSLEVTGQMGMNIE